jgi:bacillithiol system protein YtxJ
MSDNSTSYASLNTLAALDAALQRSHDVPVLLFKHSASCGVSAVADEQVRQFLDTTGAGVLCGIVVVQRARGVSDAIVERFGVRHESPQALLVREGRVVWHASHWRVTASALRDALSAAAVAL